MKKKKKFPLFNSATNEKSPIHHPFVSSPGRGKQEKEEKAKKIRKKDDDDWLWTYTPHGSSLLSFLGIGFISR